MSKVMRSVKNVTKGYSSIQVKVRNGMAMWIRVHETVTDDNHIATSNDPWGPTGTEMQEIAQMTYNSWGDQFIGIDGILNIL